MINFNDPRLVRIYGSWVRVQVAFYDYLFEQGTQVDPLNWKLDVLVEVTMRFKEGDDLYERSIRAIERRFGDAETAWREFTVAALVHPG